MEKIPHPDSSHLVTAFLLYDITSVCHDSVGRVWIWISEAGWSWIGVKLRSSKTCRSSESFCLFVFLVCSAEHFPFLVFHSEWLCLRALSRGKASLESEKGWQEKVGQTLKDTHIRSLAEPRQGPVLLCDSVSSIAVFDTVLCQWERACESPVSCLIKGTGCFQYWIKLSAKGLVLHLEKYPTASD